MTPERGDGPGAGGTGAPAPGDDESAAGDDRTISVFGVEVVVEEAFVTFPWRAGMWRAPAAFAGAYVLVAILVLVGGTGSGSVDDQLASIGIVTYNAHNIHATVGGTPDLLVPIAEPLANLRGVWRLIRGLFTVGVDHRQPATHAADIAGGKTDVIGHFSYIQQTTDPDVPSILYYLVPVSVLVGVGYEFADSYWEETVTDSPVEVVRFGLAVAAGYVLVLLAGTIPFTLLSVSPLTGAVTVLPDRYLTVVFGLVYPAVFASLGAAVVYLQRAGSGAEESPARGGRGGRGDHSDGRGGPSDGRTDHSGERSD